MVHWYASCHAMPYAPKLQTRATQAEPGDMLGSKEATFSCTYSSMLGF